MNQARYRAFVGVGSNLDEPLAQVAAALTAMAVIADTDLVAQSSCYRSTPLGPADQPDYINAVVELATALSPHALLAELQAIENAQGRQRVERWGPRTLDLDLLLYADWQLHTDALTLPHPEMHKRAFVLVPLLEIAPDTMIPGLASAALLLQQIPAYSNSLMRVNQSSNQHQDAG